MGHLIQVESTEMSLGFRILKIQQESEQFRNFSIKLNTLLPFLLVLSFLKKSNKIEGPFVKGVPQEA